MTEQQLQLFNDIRRRALLKFGKAYGLRAERKLSLDDIFTLIPLSNLGVVQLATAVSGAGGLGDYKELLLGLHRKVIESAYNAADAGIPLESASTEASNRIWTWLTENFKWQ